MEEGGGEQGAVGREKMMGELVLVWCQKLGNAECSGRKGIGMWKIRLEGIREGWVPWKKEEVRNRRQNLLGTGSVVGLGSGRLGMEKRGWRSQQWCCWRGRIG